MTSRFLRYTPADLAAHRLQIEQEQLALQTAQANGDSAQALDHAANLGALLTSDRRETEAYELLSDHLEAARRMTAVEASAWLLHALATAAQYTGRYDEANRLFTEALKATETHGWRTLQHFVLHHWGRCLAEQDRLAEARSLFEQSLAIREQLGDPRQESSRRALAELARRGG